VIIGRADNRDVLRLQGFLRRNGHPYQTLDPDSDGSAKTLEQFMSRIGSADGAVPHGAT